MDKNKKDETSIKQTEKIVKVKKVNKKINYRDKKKIKKKKLKVKKLRK